MQKTEKVNVLMLGSDLSVKGGMVSVIKNYLNYKNWDEFNITFIPTHIEKGSVYKMIYFIKSLIQIIFIIATKKIDVVHMHVAERGSFYRKSIIVLVCKIFKVSTILHHHGAEFDLFYNQATKNKQKYISYILENVDINVVLSGKLTQMITSKAPKAKVDFLYNGVNIGKNNLYNKDAKNILFLGRLGTRKGTYDLLSAIKKIDNDIDSDIKVYLCGDGEIEEVKKVVTNLEIQHRVAHVGWIDKKEKEEFFENASINILPSYNEGLPMTILETMAYGIPNISTNIASIPEVIENGVNGYLITPGDKDNLAKKIIELIDNAELRSSLSISSYNTISSKFSLESNIKKLKRIYSSLV